MNEYCWLYAADAIVLGPLLLLLQPPAGEVHLPSSPSGSRRPSTAILVQRTWGLFFGFEERTFNDPKRIDAMAPRVCLDPSYNLDPY